MVQFWPAEETPLAWTATAWPTHPDWGDAAPAARAEIAALAAALAGETPAVAVVRRPASSGAETPIDPGVAAMLGAGLAGGGSQAPMGEGTFDPATALRLWDGRSDRRDQSPASAGSGLMLGLGQSMRGPSAAVDPPQESAAPADAASVLFGGDLPGDLDTAGGALLERVVRRPLRYGDIWLRDTGPIITQSAEGLHAAAFHFNGWGGRYLYQGDGGVADALARLAGVGLTRLPMFGEPGALITDGEGTAIASRRCLLNANRNPTLGSHDVAQLLRPLGIERIVWLEEALANDHTDGHADTLVRFVRPGLVVTEAPAGREDVNARERDAVARRLDGARDAQGRRLDVARIPGAAAPVDPAGWPLPASHLNFVVAGRRLIAPIYGADTTAHDAVLDALAEVFADRELMGSPADALITGGGAFHCCTWAAPKGALGPDDWPPLEDGEGVSVEARTRAGA